MITHLQNLQLLQQISDGNPFKKTLVPAVFDIPGDFLKDVEAVAVRRDLSVEGKRTEVQKHLRRAVRDLRDVVKPFDEYRSVTETMNAKASKLPPCDKTDLVGALNRIEFRNRSCAMTPGQRAGKLIGPDRSIAFLDAVLEYEGSLVVRNRRP